jgi:hypothetical protein
MLAVETGWRTVYVYGIDLEEKMMNQSRQLFPALMAIAALLPVTALAASVYNQNAQVLSSGGGQTAEGHYKQFGVLGQGLIGEGMSEGTAKSFPGVTGILTASPDPAVTNFADVPTTYWSHLFIESLYASGVTGGCGTNPKIYCPSATVTRAQMAVFLERAMRGSDTLPAATGVVFADVSTSYWAATSVEALYADGVTGGCATGPLRYCPDTNVTRAQMAVFLLRAKHGKTYAPPSATGVFADVPTTYWAAAWIEQLYHDGVTTGCSASPLNYCPESNVSRDQMAVFLDRAFGLP